MKINELGEIKGSGMIGGSIRIVWWGFRGLKPLKKIGFFFLKFLVNLLKVLNLS